MRVSRIGLRGPVVIVALFASLALGISAGVSQAGQCSEFQCGVLCATGCSEFYGTTCAEGGVNDSGVCSYVCTGGGGGFGGCAPAI